MKILNHKQILQKVERLAYEIYENNEKVANLIFLGINKNGFAFGKLLMEKYQEISGNKATLASIRLDAADPLSSEIILEDAPSLNNKNVIVVDDVANTGRTIFYAMKPIFNFLPKKVQAAVLVDRKHKSFPIHVDYVGLSLATTLKEHIKVDIKKESNKAAFLQ